MSRTVKDVPFHVWQTPEWWNMLLPRGKKQKRSFQEYHGWSTPSWWTRLKMNRPTRRKFHVDERKILVSDISEFDFQDFGKKPHKYYW